MQITNFTINAKCLEEDTTFMLYCTETVCSLLSSHIKVQRIPKRMIQQLRHIFQYLTGESLSSDHTQSPSSSSSEIFNAWKVVLNHKRKLFIICTLWVREGCCSGRFKSCSSLAALSPIPCAQEQQGQQIWCCFKEEDTHQKNENDH